MEHLRIQLAVGLYQFRVNIKDTAINVLSFSPAEQSRFFMSRNDLRIVQPAKTFLIVLQPFAVGSGNITRHTLYPVHGRSITGQLVLELRECVTIDLYRTHGLCHLTLPEYILGLFEQKVLLQQ